MKAVELVEYRENSTIIFYPISCRVYLSVHLTSRTDRRGPISKQPRSKLMELRCYLSMNQVLNLNSQATALCNLSQAEQRSINLERTLTGCRAEFHGLITAWCI